MFKRIQLPYDYADLEPAIDKETVKTHYDGHHKTYEEKFNELIQKAPELKDKEPLEILRNLDKAPSEVRTGLKNNGGGFCIHNLYFESLIPGGKKAQGDFLERVKKDFGSFDAMVEKLDEAATSTLFGSGWAWLVEKNGTLDVVTSANQDLPEGDCKLLLPLDMWEHAYYLKYKNKKKEYTKAFFTIVNWEKVAERCNK